MAPRGQPATPADPGACALRWAYRLCRALFPLEEGFGTDILHGALAEARKLDIVFARVTCDEENIGSRRVIEKNGGVLLDVVDNTVDGVYHRTRRYDVPTE